MILPQSFYLFVSLFIQLSFLVLVVYCLDQGLNLGWFISYEEMFNDDPNSDEANAFQKIMLFFSIISFLAFIGSVHNIETFHSSTLLDSNEYTYSISESDVTYKAKVDYLEEPITTSTENIRWLNATKEDLVCVYKLKTWNILGVRKNTYLYLGSPPCKE